MGSNIDIGRAIGAPFKDPEWVKKTLLGGLWFILVVTTPAVIGAMLDYVSGVSRNDDRLPDWDDFGDKWVRGFLASIGGAIYALPALLIMLIGIIPAAFAAMMSNGGNGGGAGLAAAISGSCLLVALATLYLIAVSILLYGAYVNYAMTGSFSSMFAFGDIMARIRSDSGYFMAWLFSIVISIGMSIVSGILSPTGIGLIIVPFAYYLSMMMTANLFGQYAANAYGTGTPASSGGSAPSGYAPPAPTYVPPMAPPMAPPMTPPMAPPAGPTPPAAAPPAPPMPPSTPGEPPPAPPAFPVG